MTESNKFDIFKEIKSPNKNYVNFDEIDDTKYSSTLNKDQLDTFKGIKSILNDWNSKMYLIEGYAGTGKTYLISKLVDFITQNNRGYKVAMTAPTNKAVKVLQKMNSKNSSIGQNQNIRCTTIHKLLGLKENIDENGNITFVADNFVSNNTSSIYDFNMVIVDESSMLDDTLFEHIESYANKILIIFIGDPFQIPPVNKEDSIPFIRSRNENSNIIRFSLNEIMRQSSENPIIKISMIIRDNIHRKHYLDNKKSQLSEDESLGVVFLNSSNVEDKKRTLDLMISFFDSNEFKVDSDYVKIIAWTNKRVEMMNNYVRSRLFGVLNGNRELEQLCVGEKLIANKPIFHNDGTILFNTSDEFEVESFSEEVESFYNGSDCHQLKYFSTNVKYYDLTVMAYESQKIKILSNESLPTFNKILQIKKVSAITESDKTRKKSLWKEYYSFMNKYANVNYNYAITAHKSQGSTYKNTFVIESDINRNQNVVEKNRILYTACTRPSNILYYIYE